MRDDMARSMITARRFPPRLWQVATHALVSLSQASIWRLKCSPMAASNAAPATEEMSMTKLLSIAVALGLAVSFATPGLAADKTPTTKAACEKAHMKWDDSTKTCSKGGGGY